MAEGRGEEEKDGERMKRILVIVKPPEQDPFVMFVQNRLESLQRLVGGYIEVGVQLMPESEMAGVCILCNEEGRLIGLPENRVAEPGLRGMVGQIVAIGTRGEDFASLSSSRVPMIMRMLRLPKGGREREMDGQVTME